MTIITDIDQSAIRQRLSHDLRASLFNIDGFMDELRISVAAMERLLREHQGQLPDSFRSKLGQLINDDTRPCLDCLEIAATQLQEGIDMLTMSSEAVNSD